MTTHRRKCKLENTNGMNAATTHFFFFLNSSRYIQFGVMSPQNMVKISEFEITQRDLYMPESRTPIKGGVLDLRLVRMCIERLKCIDSSQDIYRVLP